MREALDWKKLAVASVDAYAAEATALSDGIWELAELSLLEFASMALYEKALEKAGFAVETGLCGVQTAFSGTFGAGKPVIGILGEFDALSGLSQESGCTEKKPVPGRTSGHGCGHNLLGAGAFAAACAVKRYLEKSGASGTVIFFGCPGEEGGAGKAFMAREGAWKSLDAALTWHPADCNEIATGSNMACIQKEFRFSGVASHAAGAPEQGRSALDAAELLNIGVQFLREHMPKTASIHYAFTDGGGVSPNVVQPTAAVLYMVRDSTVQKAIQLQARVDQIAKAAAMMTETEVSERFIDGCANPVPNVALEAVLYRNFQEIGAPTYTAEETAFAQKLADTYAAQVAGMPLSTGAEFDEGIREQVDALSAGGTKPLLDYLAPEYHAVKLCLPGSTDVGDVSWQTPTAQIHAVTVPSRCPGHSWQEVACGKTSIAHKGMLTAGKVLAAACIDLFEQPALLEAARAEFIKATAEGYQCPIPEDAKPTAV